MHHALSRRADEIFEALPSDPHRTAAARIFKALTERGADGRGIRRPSRLGPLTAIAGSEAPVARLVIEAYRAPGVTFLMPPVKSVLDDNAVIDISHEPDAHLGPARSWVDEEKRNRRAFTDGCTKRPGLHAEKRASLYHDPISRSSLRGAKPANRTRPGPSSTGGGFDEAMRFLDASREAVEREKGTRSRPPARTGPGLRAGEAQRLRAEEQRRAARRLRAIVALAGVAVVAVVVVPRGGGPPRSPAQ